MFQPYDKLNEFLAYHFYSVFPITLVVAGSDIFPIENRREFIIEF